MEYKKTTISKIIEMVEAEEKKWNYATQFILEINEIKDEQILNMIIQVAEAKKLELRLMFKTKENKALPVVNQDKQQTKLCKECGKTKSISEFYKQKRSPDGLQHYCKLCHNLACKKNQKKQALKKSRKMMKDKKE